MQFSQRFPDVALASNRALTFVVLPLCALAVFALVDRALGIEMRDPRPRAIVDIGLALAFGLAVPTYVRPTSRLIDRLFWRRRYASTVELERLSRPNPGVYALDDAPLIARATDILDLRSLALFRRSADGGFIRAAAAGWLPGTTWHLLPADPLAQALSSGGPPFALTAARTGDIDLPKGAERPVLATSVRRRGQAEAVLLLGRHANGVAPTRDEARLLVDIFARMLAHE